MDLSYDWDYVLRIARERLSNNRTSNHVSMYGDEIEIIGAAGELAARRYFGLPERLHTGFDSGTDFVWRGLRVDVKATKLTTNLEARNVQWPYSKPIYSDVILMAAVSINWRIATLIGYATSGEIASAPINRERRHPCHEIPFAKLHPLWEFYSNGLVSSTKRYLQHCQA